MLWICCSDNGVRGMMVPSASIIASHVDTFVGNPPPFPSQTLGVSGDCVERRFGIKRRDIQREMLCERRFEKCEQLQRGSICAAFSTETMLVCLEESVAVPYSLYFLEEDGAPYLADGVQ